MKKELRYILTIVILYTASLFLMGYMLRVWFSGNEDGEITIYAVKIITRIILLAGLLWLIKKTHITNFVGFFSKVHNPYVLSFPLVIVVIGILGNWDIYSTAHPARLSLFIISDLLVGLDEEILLRGIVLPLFILAYIQKKRAILWGVLLSSLLFGLLHFMNLLRQPGNYEGITSQVFLAFALGIFFSGLFLRTGNILVVVLLHAFINMIFPTSTLLENKVTDTGSNIETTTNEWNFLFASLIVFAFFIFSGLFMIRQADKNIIVQKINEIKL